MATKVQPRHHVDPDHCLPGLFVGLIDANAINLALPAIRDSLGGGISGAQWTIDAYNITFAAVLLTTGCLGDRFGRRTLLRLSLVTFIAASLACAAAPSLPLLLAARAVGDGGGGDVAAGSGHHRRGVSRSHRARPGDGGVGDGGGDEHCDRR